MSEMLIVSLAIGFLVLSMMSVHLYSRFYEKKMELQLDTLKKDFSEQIRSHAYHIERSLEDLDKRLEKIHIEVQDIAEQVSSNSRMLGSLAATAIIFEEASDNQARPQNEVVPPKKRGRPPRITRPAPQIESGPTE